MSLTAEEDRLQRRRRQYLLKTGRPCLVRGEKLEAVQARIRSAAARGMSFQRMEEQTGVPEGTIRHLLSRRSALASTLAPMSRLRFEGPSPTSRVDPTGTVRRLGALARDGFSGPFVAESLGMDATNLWRITGRGPKFVTRAMAEAVAGLYDKLEGVRPEDVGVGQYARSRAVMYAAKRGDAPRHCWDPDTIDDPEAIPEWTGACGTPRGLHIHYRERILPACDACLDTRTVDTPHAGSCTSSFSGEKLKAVRERRGVTVKDLAVDLGVNKDTVYYWETGRSSPRSEERLRQLCTVLGCMEIDLIEET